MISHSTAYAAITHIITLFTLCYGLHFIERVILYYLGVAMGHIYSRHMAHTIVRERHYFDCPIPVVIQPRTVLANRDHRNSIMDNHSSLTEVVEAVQLLAGHTMPRHYRASKATTERSVKGTTQVINLRNM